MPNAEGYTGGIFAEMKEFANFFTGLRGPSMMYYDIPLTDPQGLLAQNVHE